MIAGGGVLPAGFENQLRAERNRLLAEFQRPIQLPAAGDRKGDLCDQSTGSVESHIEAKLKADSRRTLVAVEDALKRCHEGTHGLCHDCGGPISAARLAAIPWADRCITCT